jgi:hypothetical protein
VRISPKTTLTLFVQRPSQSGGMRGRFVAGA